jgi:hypothetical protein
MIQVDIFSRRIYYDHSAKPFAAAAFGAYQRPALGFQRGCTRINETNPKAEKALGFFHAICRTDLQSVEKSRTDFQSVFEKMC